MREHEDRGRARRVATAAATVLGAVAIFAALGGIGLASGVISAAQYQYGGGKITICHKGKNTITVSQSSWPAHQRQGDTMGPCPNGKVKGKPPTTGKAKTKPAVTKTKPTVTKTKPAVTKTKSTTKTKGKSGTKTSGNGKPTSAPATTTTETTTTTAAPTTPTAPTGNGKSKGNGNGNGNGGANGNGNGNAGGNGKGNGKGK